MCLALNFIKFLKIKQRDFVNLNEQAAKVFFDSNQLYLFH